MYYCYRPRERTEPTNFRVLGFRIRGFRAFGRRGGGSRQNLPVLFYCACVLNVFICIYCLLFIVFAELPLSCFEAETSVNVDVREDEGSPTVTTATKKQPNRNQQATKKQPKQVGRVFYLTDRWHFPPRGLLGGSARTHMH